MVTVTFLAMRTAETIDDAGSRNLEFIADAFLAADGMI